MDLSPFLALLPIALLSLVFFFSTGRKSKQLEFISARVHELLI